MKKILVILMSVLCGCGQPAESNNINELASKDKTFNFSQAIGNNWDKVYIFSPYSSIRLVCDKTLPKWNECNDKFPNDKFNHGHLAEVDYYIVLENNGVITNAFTHNRASHSFQTTENPLIITKKYDHVLVNEDGVIVFQQNGDSNVYTK
jgi:hypothetical protein